MSDPFRDELSAALEHVARLESENEELRARVAASEKDDAEEELKRLRADNDALRRDKRQLATKNDELRGVHAENETLRKENEDLLARNMELGAKPTQENPPLFVGLALVLGMVAGHFIHC